MVEKWNILASRVSKTTALIYQIVMLRFFDDIFVAAAEQHSSVILPASIQVIR